MSSKTQPIVFVLLFIVCRPASAFDFILHWLDQRAAIDITETLVLDYHQDNYDLSSYNDNYADMRNRLNLSLAIGDIFMSLRFDTSNFIRSPERAVPPYLDRYGLEKMSASYLGKTLRLTLGDFYACFGRGIALRIKKVDELGQDTTLLGAKARIQTDLVEVTGFAGFSNPTNNDSMHEKTLADPYDLVSGLQTTWRLANTTMLGLHGLAVFFDPFERNDQRHRLPKRAYIGGASFQVPDLSDWGNLYGEFNWLGKLFEPAVPLREQMDLVNSTAFYLAWNFLSGDWSVMVELKSYEDFDLYSWTSSDGGKHHSDRIDYIRPPTLEPEEMEVANNRDVTGARLNLDWRPDGATTLLFFGYSGFMAQNEGSKGRRVIYHALMGAEQDYLRRGRARLSLGIRQEQPDYTGGEYQDLFYIKALLKIHLGVNHCLDLHGFNWWPRHHSPLGEVDYLKGEWTLGYSWSPFMDVGMILGYDTEISGSRTLDFFHVAPDGTKVRQVFLAGSLAVYLFKSRLVVRVLGGQLRGGLKCVAGGCRIIPPFTGIRLETVIRL